MVRQACYETSTGGRHPYDTLRTLESEPGLGGALPALPALPYTAHNTQQCITLSAIYAISMRCVRLYIAVRELSSRVSSAVDWSVGRCRRSLRCVYNI